jgi:hypothetical protein
MRPKQATCTGNMYHYTQHIRRIRERKCDQYSVCYPRTRVRPLRPFDCGARTPLDLALIIIALLLPEGVASVVATAGPPEFGCARGKSSVDGPWAGPTAVAACLRHCLEAPEYPSSTDRPGSTPSCATRLSDFSSPNQGAPSTARLTRPGASGYTIRRNRNVPAHHAVQHGPRRSRTLNEKHISTYVAACFAPCYL